MGFFSWLGLKTLARPAPQNSWLLFNTGFLASTASFGKTVTELGAMQMTAVYSCVRILAEAIAGLPLHVYRTDRNGSRVKALEHPLYHLLHDEPGLRLVLLTLR